MNRRRSLQWGLALGLLALTLSLPWFWPPESERSPASQPKSSDSPAAPTSPSRQEAASPSKEADLRDWLRDESLRVGTTDENPDLTLTRLRERAERLTETDLKSLEILALDPGGNGDQRFLSVEMIAMSPLEQSAEALGRIAVAQSPSRPIEPLLESALRARALEGLGAHSSPIGREVLRKSLERLDESFLIDRAQRALLAAEEKVPPPEEQDRSALDQLLRSGP